MNKSKIYSHFILIIFFFLASVGSANNKLKNEVKRKQSSPKAGIMLASQKDIQEILNSYLPEEPKFFKVIEKKDKSVYYIELVNSRTGNCEGKQVAITDRGVTFMKRTWPCRGR